MLLAFVVHLQDLQFFKGKYSSVVRLIFTPWLLIVGEFDILL